MRRIRHMVLPVRSWRYVGLLLVSLACLTLGLVSRDREGRAGSLAGPELEHRAPHEYALNTCKDSPSSQIESRVCTKDGLDEVRRKKNWEGRLAAHVERSSSNRVASFPSDRSIYATNRRMERVPARSERRVDLRERSAYRNNFVERRTKDGRLDRVRDSIRLTNRNSRRQSSPGGRYRNFARAPSGLASRLTILGEGTFRGRRLNSIPLERRRYITRAQGSRIHGGSRISDEQRLADVERRREAKNGRTTSRDEERHRSVMKSRVASQRSIYYRLTDTARRERAPNPIVQRRSYARLSMTDRSSQLIPEIDSNRKETRFDRTIERLETRRMHTRRIALATAKTRSRTASRTVDNRRVVEGSRGRVHLNHHTDTSLARAPGILVRSQADGDRRSKAKRMISLGEDISEDAASRKNVPVVGLSSRGAKLDLRRQQLLNEASDYPDSIYEVARQLLVVTLCTIYGISVFKVKGSLLNNVRQGASRLVAW